MQLEEGRKGTKEKRLVVTKWESVVPIMTESYRVIKLRFHILPMPLLTGEQKVNKHTVFSTLLVSF